MLTKLWEIREISIFYQNISNFIKELKFIPSYLQKFIF